MVGPSSNQESRNSPPSKADPSRLDSLGWSLEALKGRVRAWLRGKIRRFELVVKKQLPTITCQLEVNFQAEIDISFGLRQT